MKSGYIPEIKEVIMRNYIPAHLYLYDFKHLFVRFSATAAIAIILYSVLFGSIS